MLSAATMSSAQSLREFIRERLTAAAEEIFTEVDKTIVLYEEELDRLRLLETKLKPPINLQRIDLPKHYLWRERDSLSEQQFHNYERNSSLHQKELQPQQMQETQGEMEPLQMKEEQEKHEPLQIKYEQEELEPQQMQENQDELEVICVKEELQESELPHVKDEQEELCINLEKKEFEPKQDTEMFIVNLAYKNKKNREQELSRDQISSEPQNQNQERSIHEKSGSSRGEELRQNKKCQAIRGHNENVDSPEVKRQKKTHMNDKLSCKICGKFFARNYVNQHIRTHTGERPFSCLTCGKSFSERGNLSKHIRTHTGEKSFSCLICGKSFTQQIHLTCHMRTHTGEKPFSCLICGKSFSLSSSLSGHMRTHTGEKPFSCLTCGLSFSKRGSLFHHSRVHTGEKPFSCTTCGKNFSQRSNLTVHMKIHTSEELNLCEICGSCFSQRGDLTDHMKTHRGEQV